jgi:prepilin peptidase CpaA
MSFDPEFGPALAVAGLGAILDIRVRRLPNWLCALLALSAVGGLVALQGASALPSSLLHAAIVLIFGMALFKAGMIGAGDAKFYAAAAAGLPLAEALPFLGWTSVVGLALLLAMVAGRLLRPGEQESSILKGWSVPYGVAIAGGFGLTVAVS